MTIAESQSRHGRFIFRTERYTCSLLWKHTPFLAEKPTGWVYENVKIRKRVPLYWPFCDENPSVTFVFLSQGAGEKELRCPLCYLSQEAIEQQASNRWRDVASFLLELITHPCHDFNNGLTAPSVDLGQRWVSLRGCNYLSIPCWFVSPLLAKGATNIRKFDILLNLTAIWIWE